MARAFVASSNQYLYRASMFTPDFSYPNVRSWACWFNAASLSSGHCLLHESYDYFGICGYFLQAQTDNKLHFHRYRQSGSDYDITAAGDISTGVWHHAAATTEQYYNGDTGICYLDGNAGTSGSKPNNIQSGGSGGNFRSWIGAQVWGAPFDGSIAEVAVWTATLSATEIGLLAKGFSPLLVRPQSLALYIPLVRDNDSDIVSGLGYTPYNTPTVSAHPRVLYASGMQTMNVSAGTPAAGQPIQARGTLIPGLRQWQPSGPGRW